MCSFVAMLVTASLVVAAPTPWADPAGSQPGYSYSNGQSENGLFGSPASGPGFFAFAPSFMNANSSNGMPSAVSDKLSVDLLAEGSKRFGKIGVTVQGDYALLGPASVNVAGTLKLTNLITLAVLTQSVAFAPSFPVFNGVGLFAGSAEINLPTGWSSVMVEFENELTAASQQGGTGFIQTKVGTVDVTVVPLPAAAAMIPAAIPMIWWARRRFRRR
jgi:hypothetical protein